jgi:diadenosine tetraphosphate (Ap4A) HIT family hydrolase
MNGSFGRWDRYPVSRGHLLVMPFRHTLDFFSMTPEERVALVSLIDTCKDAIRSGGDGHN